MKSLLTLCMLFVLAFTGAAQDATGTPVEPSETTPFMHALSLIPNTSEVRGAEPMFSYADYHASIESRGIERPETLAAFLEDLQDLQAGQGGLEPRAFEFVDVGHGMVFRGMRAGAGGAKGLPLQWNDHILSPFTHARQSPLQRPPGPGPFDRCRRGRPGWLQ